MRTNDRDTELQQQRKMLSRRLGAEETVQAEMLGHSISGRVSGRSAHDKLSEGCHGSWRHTSLPALLYGEAEPYRALRIGSCTMSVTRSNSSFLAMCPTQGLKLGTFLFLVNSPGAFPQSYFMKL